MSLLEPTHQHLLAHHGDFSTFADLMEQTFVGRFDPVFWAFLEQQLPQNPLRIVDMGTGPGLMLFELSKRFPQASVFGLEAQPEMLKRFEKQKENHPSELNTRIQMIPQDLMATPYPLLEEASVDFILISMVLHELMNPTLLLKEVHRLLKKGGVVVVYDWIRHDLGQYFEGRRPESIEEITHFSEHCRYTEKDLEWYLEASGLSVKEWMTRKKGKFVLLSAQK